MELDGSPDAGNGWCSSYCTGGPWLLSVFWFCCISNVPTDGQEFTIPAVLTRIDFFYLGTGTSEVEVMDVLQSFLFVPADSSRKMASARNLRPDAFIYDLEDAVPVANKHEARHLLTGELNSFINPRPKIFVRVNGFDSAFFGDDLRVAVRREVTGIILPKCHDASQIAQVHPELSRLENHMSMPEGSVKVIPILESAKGVSRGGEIARSSSRIIAFFFGGEDFCADMGISRSKNGDEIAVAYSLVALAAKSGNRDSPARLR
jgi:citrate lyase subunit beta/citryl-CoA lyase